MTTQQFFSLEMIAEIEEAAHKGCLYSQTQLEELTSVNLSNADRFQDDGRSTDE